MKVAIRDSQYKLLHAFTGNALSEWYDFADKRDDGNQIVTLIIFIKK